MENLNNTTNHSAVLQVLKDVLIADDVLNPKANPTEYELTMMAAEYVDYRKVHKVSHSIHFPWKV
jgi:hypothetical protein